jgi:hypothetical protein
MALLLLATRRMISIPSQARLAAVVAFGSLIGCTTGSATGDDAGGGAGARAGAAGTSSSGGGASGTTGGAGASPSGGAGGSGTGTGGTGGGYALGVPIWETESESIAISSGSFFGGSSRFEKQREELTAEELVLLGSITTVASSTECWSDTWAATLTVRGNGGVREYFASEGDQGCDRDVVLVANEPVKSLVQAAKCLNAKSYDGTSLATAAHVTAGNGCYHGLFNASGTTPDWWFVLDVTEAGSYRLSLDGCSDRVLDMALLDETGVTELSSVTGTPGSCSALTHDVASPGSYAIHVTMTAGTSAGDFYLRIDAEP